MTDLPPGKWSPLLVGQYWPGAGVVTSSANAARNRSTVHSFFDDYSRQLTSTVTTTLAPMRGYTADAIVDLFRTGEAHATTVSEKNATKQKAFLDAVDALNGLRSELTSIAVDGNSKIDEINSSGLDPRCWTR